MSSNLVNFPTTYVYKQLPSDRHVRLLEIVDFECNTTPLPEKQLPGHDAGRTRQPAYRLIEAELPPGDGRAEFEALSYTWGAPDRISTLSLEGEEGHIGLNSNLTEALPHITRQSTTRQLWIDQICINQGDNAERSIQVGLMAELYKKARHVIVWLGPEDKSSLICKEWLIGNEMTLPTLPNAHRAVIGNPEYRPSWRFLILQDTFLKPDADPVFATAIAQFWARPWFRRGWIVQEFLLPPSLTCLTGTLTFTLQDLQDLWTLPATDELSDATDGSMSHFILMQLKTNTSLTSTYSPDPQPLRFLRIMAEVAGKFQTKELADRLNGFLGLLEGLEFVPDYSTPVRENFTRFVATVARQYGSLDFLSLWSKNIDEITIKITPKELLGMPSWVPSFQDLPLMAPYRLAVGGSRSSKRAIGWKAAGGRRHIHDQVFDGATTGRLQVRGRIIDHVETVSPCKIDCYFDIDTEYLASLTAQISSDIPGLEHWTHIDLVTFLNTVSCNGHAPNETAEKILGLVPGGLPDEYKHLHKNAESLGACLSMGTGRRFMRTEQGRLGLAPFIGSRARSERSRGSVIAVLHGYIVPIVLERVDGQDEKVDGGEWSVVGDCYVEDVMHGEAVNWKIEDAQTFILV